MVSTEVQRTLVKSPPELWAELSDPAALARHLGDLGDIGEIRVTRVHTEERVEWEGTRISGTVLMKASGWGTKVTLRVSRELDVQAPATTDEAADDCALQDKADPDTPPADVDSQSTAEPDGAVTPVSAAEPHTQAQPADAATMQADEQPSDDQPAAHTQSSPRSAETDRAAEAEDQPEPRRGFFSRLFRRRRPAAPSEPADAAPADEPAAGIPPVEPVATGEPAAPSERVVAAEHVAAGEPVATAKPQAFVPPPEPVSEPSALPASSSEDDATPPAGTDTPTVDLSAELKDAEQAANEEVTAVLTATLDRLGAAHHRPFSRA